MFQPPYAEPFARPRPSAEPQALDLLLADGLPPALFGRLEALQRITALRRTPEGLLWLELEPGIGLPLPPEAASGLTSGRWLLVPVTEAGAARPLWAPGAGPAMLDLARPADALAAWQAHLLAEAPVQALLLTL